MDAWRVTQEDHDVHDIATMRLTNYEIIILNGIAINLFTNGKRESALRLFEDLRNNINHFIVDGVEKMRTYLLVSYNYTKQLGLNNQHYRVLDITEEGINRCIQYFDVRRVAGLVVNKAYSLLELGDKEKSVPHFAIAYYVFGLFNRTEHQRNIKHYVEERLGLVFS